MEDKDLYMKVMIIAACLIAVLLCAGMFSWFYGRKDKLEQYIPHGKVQVLIWEPEQPFFENVKFIYGINVKG